MKTIVALSSLLISGLFVMQIAKCQSSTDKTVAMNTNNARVENRYLSVTTDEKTTVDKKDDVVINMAMIESFRRCYDKIQPFNFADYFRGDASEISIKYMAFMRVRAKNVTENFDQALNAEIENIKSEMQHKPKFNTMIAYSEEKVCDQSKVTAKEQPTAEQKDQTLNSGKESTKTVKWMHIKS